ncbi:MAG: glycosyltransferase family 4 protein [Gemmatales bacterium]
MNQALVNLAVIGDANSPVTWSGIPYHFLQAAQAFQLIDRGLPLSTAGTIWKQRRLFWNAWRVMTRQGRGGYQYSVSFLEKLWKPWLAQLLDQTIINCFQLYPPSLVQYPRYHKYYYIDMTLLQLFDEYGDRERIGPAIARDALAREKEGYQAAEKVVCHSRWAAESVINDYGVAPDKVHAIIPGANLNRKTLLHWQENFPGRTRQPGEPLKLIFIGKYWDRKGLDRLLEALLLVQQHSSSIELKVLGCEKQSLPAHLQNVPNVEWLGFIDKRKELPRFLQLLAEADVGCLLSRAEAGGMVLREYHAAGLIVMGPRVGGAPEHLFSEAGQAFPPSATPLEVADWLLRLMHDQDYYHVLRNAAWACRHLATWDETVRQWRTIMPARYIP